jgi:endonuclease/exonuclease/phosphatase family metal-dependent hydrolase
VSVRIASYNVRGMKDSLPALVRVVRAMRADVLCLQEAPGPLSPRGGRRVLAQLCGLRVAAASRLGGVAVLAGPRARVLHAEDHVLRFFAGLQVRALAIAVVEVGGARLAVGSVHLDLHGAARLRHAAEALGLLRRAAGRFGAVPVLGGDVNERPHQPTWRYLAAQLADCHQAASPPAGDGFTFTARDPRARIDAVFAAPGTPVVSCGCADASPADLAGASDHLPVVADLGVGG